MSELLIELLCEEIPAMMQRKAELAYNDIFNKYFQEREISFKKIEIFISVRRIVICVSGLDTKTKSSNISIKGPRTDAPSAAVEGFCKSNDIVKNELIVREIKGTECYFYEKNTPIQDVSFILEESLHEPIMAYIWPKSMHWGDYRIKWIRPISNILCIFDEKTLAFKLGHLVANNITFGHKFISTKKISHEQGLYIKNFAQYKSFLADNFVILSFVERINLIKTSLQAISKKLGLVLKEDQALLEEVAGLVEFPVVMAGSIEQKFLNLPSEILVSSMRSHQKYFSLFDNEGKFAPYFLFVSNINPSDPSKVIQGNERVLSARLSDALYFYNQDLKKTLENRVPDLKRVIFHAKLGSLKEKTDRLTSLIKFIDAQALDAIDAAQICKSDILTEVVGEFPNLQGIMGYYYALENGKTTEVAIAIRDHYKPQGPSDLTPSGSGALLALADKIDSLCGLMIAGERPTGSKDPYALRRIALGIIRIILENNIEYNLVEIVEFTCQLYKKPNSAEVISTVLLFLEERVKNHLKDQFNPDIVNALVNINHEPDLTIILGKMKALEQFLNQKNGSDLLNSYKRASNIIANNNPQGLIDKTLFKSQYEHNLLEFLEMNYSKIDQALNEKNFFKSLEILSNMKNVITDFFDYVMVMDENPIVANNRLLLLQEVKLIFSKIANFEVL